MKFFTFLLIFNGLCVELSAQQHAYTDSGKTVLLNPNGTWTYETLSNEKEESQNLVSDSNLKRYSKPVTSTALLKSTKNSTGFWYNSKAWRKLEQSFSESAEFSLTSLAGDAYCMIVNEGIELTYALMKEAVVKNAGKLSKDFEVLSEEYRIVNGKKVLVLTAKASTQGIKFRFLYYIYTGPEGTTQLIAYTSNNIFEKSRKDFENFLNGFMVFKN